MRILVDMSDDDIKSLGNLSKMRKVSRAALIRQAIAQYLEKHRTSREVEGFGVWKSSGHACYVSGQ